ncbi:hypothetical protein IQ266_16890 [filamentous cyanobacterium LEGE 11480]|uniref:Uncharacterized protein n=1 Tax=Romeriopsis navalis LEGE 11480 TaxID=2777977 RepID=A0A928Z5F3_9CYAN|nr:hypothetical protein [Romeriopsis navalis]MBE9031413.1 hypothetical protein [Romeriopsis navalis LEGE 11480]
MTLSISGYSWLIFGLWLGGRWLHELAHTVVRYRLVTSHVRQQQRLSINPLQQAYGWQTWIWPSCSMLLLSLPLPARMIQVSHRQLPDRRHRTWVAAAGPLTTLSLLLVLGLMLAGGRSSPILVSWFWLELVAFGLSLVPLPGMDGYGLIEPWLPLAWQRSLGRLKRQGHLVLMAYLWSVGAPAFMGLQPRWILLQFDVLTTKVLHTVFFLMVLLRLWYLWRDRPVANLPAQSQADAESQVPVANVR